jgi:multidrug efflux system membrane fusion protein
MKFTVYSPISRPRHLLLTLLLGASACVGFAQSSTPGAAQAPAQLVTTALAKSESVKQTVLGIGNAMALASVTLHARVDGQLEEVNFQEGQEVKAGQVMVRLDPRTYQAQLDQALAQKAKDDALLSNAQNDLKRYEGLIKEDATTQQVLDTQGALVKQLQAAVQADDAQVSYARVQLGYTTIVAPLSGRVGARLIDPGNIVHAADVGGLVVINQIEPIALQFTLPESFLPAIQQALGASHKQHLQVEAVDRTSKDSLGVGELVLVNNQIDTATGTIMLKARIPNPKHLLWPGQSVNARLTLTTLNNVVTIPSSGVQRSQNGLFVYVVAADAKVHLHVVTVAQVEGSRTVVSDGLKAGDRVVVDGFYRLVEGAVVKEAGTAAKPAAGVKP